MRRTLRALALAVALLVLDSNLAHGQQEPTTPIPPVTEADREAAFPEVEPTPIRDDAVHTFVLLDQFEWQGGQSGDRSQPGPSVVQNRG